DGGNNPELGQICADRVDDGSLLANEEMAHAMKRKREADTLASEFE
ncbi:hypothetical protein IVB09_24140, partial [Bradyrhizobium sp. 174]|nr:hypothetical protein [Bradyrhizobium sp. 174]